MDERIYDIPHNLRPIMYLPYRAIHGNIDFLTCEKPKIKTQDDYIAYCTSEEVNIGDLMEEIKIVYNMNIIQFIELWEKRLGVGCIFDYLIKITVIKQLIILNYLVVIESNRKFAHN